MQGLAACIWACLSLPVEPEATALFLNYRFFEGTAGKQGGGFDSD